MEITNICELSHIVCGRSSIHSQIFIACAFFSCQNPDRSISVLLLAQSTEGHLLRQLMWTEFFRFGKIIYGAYRRLSSFHPRDARETKTSCLRFVWA